MKFKITKKRDIYLFKFHFPLYFFHIQCPQREKQKGMMVYRGK